MTNLFGLIFIVALATGLSAFVAWVAMIVWNATLSPWLNWPALTFWITWGILFLLGILGKTIRGK